MTERPGSKAISRVLSWTVLVPALAAILLVFTWGRGIGAVEA